MGTPGELNRVDKCSQKRSSSTITVRTASDSAHNQSWLTLSVSVPTGGKSPFCLYFFFGFSTETATASV